MTSDNEERQARISGYLDGELDGAEREQFERDLAADPAMRAEVNAMRTVVDAADALEFEPPPDEAWDGFVDSVLSRSERNTGWILLMLGSVALVGWSLYHVLFDPWAPPTVRAGVGALGLGGAALFFSVLRQRILMRRSDRYSRDVRR